ncbi:unnamed protein product, partial [Dicrocoelium dendriticum]
MTFYDRFFSEDLPKYKYASQVREDVKRVLVSYKQLRPKIDNFIFNDGTSQDLVCLEGTIPVLYLNSTYNIPVAIFLKQSHPHAAPMVYVRPTSTMQIKASEFVDNTGLIQLPYISEWKHPASDLLGLLNVLQVVFGEKPPVFSKVPLPKTTPTPPPQPYPPGYFAQPALGTGSDGGVSSQSIGMPSLPGIGWQLPNPPAYVGMSMPQLPSYNSPFPDFGIPPTPLGGPQLDPSFIPLPGDPQQNSLSEQHLRLSLCSAVLDKIRRVQNELICQYGDELKALQQAQSDLICGGQRLKDMMSQMDREQERANEALESLKKKNAELSDLFNRLRVAENEPLNVDEAVDTTYPLYRQLVSSFAEEQAIEDAIYFLGKALGKGALELDVFLKKVRELSRRQFMLRATVQQCREKAGLPV